MTKTAVDIAKARWAEADAVADAFRVQLKRRLDAYNEAPTDEAAAAICEAFTQLGAARRHLNKAATLHKTLATRKDRECQR